jgi:hypothetical protein
MTLRRPAEKVDAVPDIELSRIQSALAGRLTSCWDRLDDAVSELLALHEVPESEILERVRQTIAAETESSDVTEAAL